MNGNIGMGCISDTDPQPLLVRSHLGLFAITTVSLINNAEELVEKIFIKAGHQFMLNATGKVNTTELIAKLINQCDNIVDGIRYAQEVIDGSCTIMIMTPDSLIVARDKVGRLPIIIGKKDTGYCACIESFACQKLGYELSYNMGPGEIIKIDQVRGHNKALMRMIEFIEKDAKDVANKILGISHCNNRERAELVKQEILKRLPFKDCIIVNTAGVSTLYANDGGIIVSYKFLLENSIDFIALTCYNA